jgi:hypothetical protein
VVILLSKFLLGPSAHILFTSNKRIVHN